MTIPSVMHGLIETEDGKVFELDSPKGSAWLESIGSFRFEPVGDNKPYTVRKEAGKGGDYWYGYRKQNGKLHKKYIGKSSEISTAKLEEIAEALNTPPQARVTDKVTEVTEGGKRVTEKVTDGVTIEEFTALKFQVQVLQESLEALRSELPGKSDAGNVEELPTVTDSKLQIELGNLGEYDHALTTQEEALAHAKIYGFTPEEALADAHFQISMLQSNYDELEDRHEAAKRELQELRSQLQLEKVRWADLEEELQARDKTCTQLQGQLSDLKQKSAPARELPDAADLLNQLRAKRKKSKTDSADIAAILEILEG